MLTVMVLPVSSQGVTESRSYGKSVRSGRETSVDIVNKYGTVEITSWNRDSVYIRAEIKAHAPSQSKIEKMFDGISVELTSEGSHVRAVTIFGQNINTLFESFKGMTSKMISYDSRVEINYYLKVPEYISLKVENKYGDVYMENCSGNLTVSLSNGSFRAGSVGAADLSMSFCDADISSIRSGSIDATFSEINIMNAGNISINSVSTRFDIKNAGEIKCESKRDKFFFDTISAIRGNSYFTDFDIKTVKKEIGLSIRYGHIEADLLENGFESVNINSGNSDISLSFDQNASCSIDIRTINSFLVLPSRNIETEKKVINEEKREYITTGTFGKSPVSGSLKIDATRGNIYLK